VNDSADPLAAIREVDPSGELEHALALPDHLEDALWRVESARLERSDASGLVICGMGGSAIGADLARAAIGERLTRPFMTVRGYSPPPWTDPDSAFLCSSYSGNTEETLACYAAAEALGARRIVATTGGALADAARADGSAVIGIPSGMQPRAAVGYMFAIAAEVAAAVGASDGIRTEIDCAAANLKEAQDAIAARASELADAVHGSIPVIFGADLTAPVATRWKSQVNENAKWPAFPAELPEADHNEIVGWSEGLDVPLAAVFITDRDQHPRIRRRFELTAELIGPAATATVSVETEGETRVERLLWAVMLGDLFSLHLAARRGVDPSPIVVLDQLKAKLAKLESGDSG
jgi:glucose/mannose-6-phosphate isomerase